MTIRAAQLDWQTDDLGEQTPVSAVFSDVYFSLKDGLSESNYVFIEHNHLPARLRQIIHQGGYFVIAETGFGTGLNFLAVLCLWYALKKQVPSNDGTHACLHFITTEKYPLDRQDLNNALKAWRNAHLYGEPLAPLIEALLACYPPHIEGCHRRHFDDAILDVWLGDATQSLSALAWQKNNTHTNPALTAQAPFVDAWFLDGFAPSKNHQMWSDDLFDVIAKLSGPTTTLATFTVAGDVRRKLIARGAHVQKVKGFGHKREMLTANFATSNYEQQTNTPPFNKNALVIGAGVAGLCTAYALANKGFCVRIIDKSALLAGASGNPRALFSPKLSQKHTDLNVQSFLYAHHFYHFLQNSTQHTQTIFEAVGVTDFLLPNKKSDEKYQSLLAAYPNDFVQRANTAHTTESFTAFLPNAGLISPHELAAAILSHPNIHLIIDTIHQIKDSADSKNTESKNTESKNIHSGVVAVGTHQNHHAQIAVVCAGFESHLVHGDIFDGRKIRGQVSWLNKNHPDYDALKHSLQSNVLKNNALKNNVMQNNPVQSNAQTSPHFAIKYDGYVCSFDERILMGASFVRNCTDDSVQDSEHAFNVTKLQTAFDNIAHIDIQQLHGRAAIRSQTPDYHPIVGQISPHIYTLSALGSKGFCLAPLCAESLAGMVACEFLPMSSDLLQKTSPKRPRLQTPIDQNA